MALTSTAADALQAAGFVGVWDTDVRAGRSVLDSGAASLMAGDPGLAGTPLPLDAALGRIHPADRDWVFGRIRHVRHTGGPVSLEFRVVTGTGETRWILNRGCLSPDSDGRLHGRGAYIDVTDLHRHGIRAAVVTGSTNGATSGATNGTMSGGGERGGPERRGRPRHPDPRGAGAPRRPLSAVGLGDAAPRDRPRAGAARPLTGLPAQVRQGWAGSSVRPMALAPASATVWSFSTVEPLTPMAPDITPSASTIGIPPGKVISPSFECSIP
jgi:hypothetical protein